MIRTVKIYGGVSDVFSLQDKTVYELTQCLPSILKAQEVEEIE